MLAMALTIVLGVVTLASTTLMLIKYSWNTPHHVMPILAIVFALLPITQAQFPHTSNGKVCVHYPSYAEKNLDADWKTTFLYMMNAKSFPPNSVVLMPYEDLLTAAAKCRDNCFADFWLLETGLQNITDISTAVSFLSYEWYCTKMDVTLYFYTQQTEKDFFVGTGTDCSMSVCLLDAGTTLGKGCITTDKATYEKVSGPRKSAVVDVTDTFTYRLEVESAKCDWQFCTQGEMKTNVFVLTMGPSIDIDDTMQTQQGEQISELQVYQARIQWREWWNLFYKLVELANKVISSVATKMTQAEYVYEYETN